MGASDPLPSSPHLPAAHDSSQLWLEGGEGWEAAFWDGGGRVLLYVNGFETDAWTAQGWLSQGRLVRR